MKKNNTAQKALLETEALSNALMEGANKKLQQILNETISDFISSDDEDKKEETDTTVDTDKKGDDEEPIQDDSYSVEDVETKDDSTTDADEEPENGEESSDETEEDDEWDSKLDNLEVGDGEYDLTSVDDDTAFEVWSKVGDDDLVHIQKLQDGKLEIKDDNTGADLVLDLDPDSDEEDDAELELATTDDEDELGDLTDNTEDTSVEDDEISVDDEDDDTDQELEISIDDEDDDTDQDEDDETLNEENLGYTDNYQKDVFNKKINMKEPANKNATYSMDGGVPTGSEKPWAGKHKEPDYTETGTDLAEACENGECETDLEESGAARTSVKKSHMVKGDKEKPEGFPARGPQAKLDEAKLERMKALTQQILAENKKYKEVIANVKQSLYEAWTTNQNYGRMVYLLVNETTSKDEKKSIVERFTKVKTNDEGKFLFETIKNEFANSHKTSTPRIDEQISANSSNTINETVIFQNNPSISLWERMEKLPELNGRKKK